MANVKIAITGAAGQIGYSLLFRIASGQIFGPNTTVEFSLIEREEALGALEGVAMELMDCAFPLLKNIKMTANVEEGMSAVNYAILVGAVPRKAGMERSDLLQLNGGVFKEQGLALNNHAADDVRVFVVGNPCNTNCLIAMNHAKDIPQERFFAMTMLDENRARALLARKANVAITAVSSVPIWGNHSATQYPDFYHATINGLPALEVIKDEQWLQNDYIRQVQQRGAEIIKARGASSAASAANAVIDSLHALVNDTPQFSLCLASRGEYGVDKGLIFSYPCQTKQGHLSIIQTYEHNAFAEEKIRLSLEELRQEREAVLALGLI